MSGLIGQKFTTANKSVGGIPAGTFCFAAATLVASASGDALTATWTMWYGSQTFKIAVYDAAGTTLLGQTNASPASSGEHTLTFTAPFAVVSGTSYIVAIIGQVTNGTALFQSNNDGTDSVGQGGAATAMPSTISPSYTGNNLGVMSITIDGTLGGSGYTATLLATVTRRIGA
jgi:hypothetical protein